VDLIRRDELLPIIEKYHNLNIFEEIIPISLTKGENCGKIIDVILKYLPEGPKYYPDDIISTENERFIVAEIVREKVFMLTHEEIPYSVGVIIDYFHDEENIAKIGASIIVERDSQKAIIIGKKGKMIKEIGIMAREEIETLLNKKVFLELFVKVIKNWTKDGKKVKEIFKEA
jgi:GTP-binding protein Era